MTTEPERKPFVVWQSKDGNYRVVAVPMPSTGNACRAGKPETDRWHHVLEAHEREDAMNQPIYQKAEDKTDYITALALLAQDYTKLVKDVMG